LDKKNPSKHAKDVAEINPNGDHGPSRLGRTSRFFTYKQLSGAKQTIRCRRISGEIGERVDKVVDVFVTEYCWSHEAQQRVELQKVVLHWSAC